MLLFRLVCLLLLCAFCFQGAVVEKETSKGELKEQLKKLASKGVESLLEPAQKPQEVEAQDQLKEVEAVDAPFAKGAKVRMVEEDVNNKRFLGEIATVEQVLKSGVAMVKFHKVEIGGLAARSMPVEAFELESFGKPVPELRTLVRTARWIKRSLLRRGGVQDPEVELLSQVKVGDQASEDHIDLFVACVEWSFGLEEQTRVKTVPVSFASRLLSDAAGEKYNHVEDVPSVEIIDKRVAMFRRWFENSDVLLIPVYAKPLSKSCQHYTLLVIDTSGSHVTVDYFESLKQMHGQCLSNAKVFLQLLDLEPALIKGRRNVAIQSGVDCGWFVCHWIEEHLRRAAGHPKQSQGWPTEARLRRLVEYLKKMINTLEADRGEWFKEVTQAKKQEAEIEKQLTEKSNKFLKTKQLLERVVETHRALGVELVHAGAADALPALDGQFLLRLDEHKRTLREQREARQLAAIEQSIEQAAADGPPLPPLPPPFEPPVEPAVKPSVAVIAALETQCKETADLDLFELVLKSARVEDLGKEQQAHYKRVEATGVGICSKCRFTSGCFNCDVKKAWRYVVKWELGLRPVDCVPCSAVAVPKPQGGGEVLEVFLRTIELSHFIRFVWLFLCFWHNFHMFFFHILVTGFSQVLLLLLLLLLHFLHRVCYSCYSYYCTTPATPTTPTTTAIATTTATTT